MGLEETFGKVEKPAKEKKLEVITSKEATIKDLRAYFEQNKYKGLHGSDECRKYLSSCMDFLKNFKLTPKIISEFNTKVGIVEEKEVLGIYFSALIQASYNQGHNNFKFEEVSAKCFGAFLKGQAKKPIKITTKELQGDSSLWYAEDCSLKAETIEGVANLDTAKNCSLTAEKLEGKWNLMWAENCSLAVGILEGNWNLDCAKNCTVKIKKYTGYYFGLDMKNCTISSPNENVLKKLKELEAKGENNTFKIIK